MLAFAILACWYASVTPYRMAGEIQRRSGIESLGDVGAPDERQHANYIRHLLTERNFPILKPNTPDLYETYQSHQPPLYYLVASPLGDPTQPGGEKTRYVNVVFGLLTIAGLFFVGLHATQSTSAGVATASMGLLPGFVMLHGAITNDPLLIALCTWTFALAVLGATTGWTVKRVVILAALVGLALLTKSSGFALVPVALLALLLGKPKADDAAPRPSIQLALGVFAVIVGVLALPWLVRNSQLYGDPLGLTVFKQAFTGTAQAKDFIAEVGAFKYWTEWVGWWTARSFIGIFGYMKIFLPDTVYRLALVLVLGSAAGAVLLKDRTPVLAKESIWLGLSLFFVVLVLFVQFNSTYFQGQARYVYPALASVALVVGAGIARATEKAPLVGGLGFAGVLAGLNVFILTSVIPEWFSRIAMVPNP